MALRLRGFLPFGVPALTSMRHGEWQAIEPGAFGPPGPMTFPRSDASAGVFLLLGYEYSNALARTPPAVTVSLAQPSGIPEPARPLPPRVPAPAPAPAVPRLPRSSEPQLSIRITAEGIEWRTGPLVPTDTATRTRLLMRAGLVGGVVAGYVPLDVEKSAYRGGTLTTVRQGNLCELNIISRPPGDGSVVARIA